MKMMRIIVKKAIKIIALSELIILLTYGYSFQIFINMQVAYLSSLFIILGSAFAYKKLVGVQLASGNYEDKRDLLDTIEDPHELYDDETIDKIPEEELDFKTIVKEEKAKIKTLSLKNMKHGARGGVSAFRLVPYLFLILGFIALKNNELLLLSIYLPSLLIGIVVGATSSKYLTL